MDTVKKATELVEDGRTPKRKFTNRELPNYFDALDDTGATPKPLGFTLHPAMGARERRVLNEREP